MASRSSRPKLERITYEDLMSSSGMSGFDALVRTNPAEIQAALDRNPEFRATVSPAAATPAEIISTQTTPAVSTPVGRSTFQPKPKPVISFDRLSTPVATTPVVTDQTENLTENLIGLVSQRIGSNTAETTPAISIPVMPTPVDRVARQQFAWRTEDGKPLGPSQRVYRVQMAQDALSRTEEAVYDILWGPKNQSGDRNRLVTMGQSELSREARLTPKNAKLAVERLIAKGFVEIAVPANSLLKRQATQYRVFSYAAALERMQARERTHVVRIVSGVFFVSPLSTPVDSLSTPAISGPVNSLATAVAKQATPVVTSQSTPVATGTPSLDIYSGMTTTSEVRDIAQTLRKTIGTVDDVVARRLIIECRRRAPDATIDEISEFIQQKATLAIRNPQIRNPSGFLITAVPICFEGESFQILRKSREEAKRQERAEMERIAKAILDDPESPDDDRSWARGILGDTRIEENAAHSR